MVQSFIFLIYFDRTRVEEVFARTLAVSAKVGNEFTIFCEKFARAIVHSVNRDE